MIDTRTEYDKLPWVRGGRYKGESDLLNSGTDWVAIDPDGVDLRVHPKLATVEYDRFVLNPGDCVFMP